MNTAVSGAVMAGCSEYPQNDSSACSAARVSRSSRPRGRRISRSVSSVGWGRKGVRHAQLVVLRDHQLLLGDAAGGALRVAGHLEGPEALLEGVVGQEPAGQGLADAAPPLDGLPGPG